MQNWILGGVIFLASTSVSQARQYYVSPAGSDRHRGTLGAPFATLAKARNTIRTERIAGTEPVTVYLLDGMYCLPETFRLEPRDSGSEEAPVVYRARNEGHAIISGATVVKGLCWRPHVRGIMKAKIPDQLLDRCAFDEIAIRDEKLHMARFPNFTGQGNFDGVTQLAAVNQRAKKYDAPTSGYLHALHGSRWGSVHYRIIGKDQNGLTLEGGWQQNRHRSINQDNVMVENVFEELDAPGEWFLDRDGKTLYIYPPEGFDLDQETLYVTNLKQLIELGGSEQSPVRHITIQGLQFRHARRIFMEDEKTWEGLNRGDWSIVRSASVLLTGTEYCAVRDCFFNQLGGNGLFFNNYNRYSEVTGSRFHQLGESAVCFVGNPACTRSNPVGYDNSIAYSKQDVTPGPHGNDYPRFCKMDDCLVFMIGRVNKQTAGALISMAENITIGHNTIFHVPRSGITINDGCWGGHLLEYNDVFDTVIETGDHGPFNSWGRDRYWLTPHHGNKAYRQPTSFAGESVSQREAQRRARLDNRTPTVIRHNRWWHGGGHTWGIDLDDGSSNYHVYNNVGLGCSVKLREGFYRRVENNIFIGGEAIQLHVPFDHNSDTICRNIVVSAAPATLPWKNPIEKLQDAELIDNNVYWSFQQVADPSLENEPLKEYQAAGIDVHSVSADPKFIDPLHFDLRVAEDSPAIRLGFKNFPMDHFGVKKPALKKLAKEGHQKYNTFDAHAIWGDGREIAAEPQPPTTRTVLGAIVKDLTTDAEQSIAGIGRKSGVFVLNVPPRSRAARAGLHANEAILAVNGVQIQNVTQLRRELKKHQGKTVSLHVVGARDRSVDVQLK